MNNYPYLLPSPYVFPVDPPPLPEISPAKHGQVEVVTRASLDHRLLNGFRLAGITGSGIETTIEVTLEIPGVVRVLQQAGHPGPARSRLVLPRDTGPERAEVEITDKQILLDGGSLQVLVELDPFNISFLRPDGSVLLEQNSTHRDATGRLSLLPFGFSKVNGKIAAYHDSFTAEPDEHYYGFGEKFNNFDKRGQRLEMWAHNIYGIHNERAYKNVPFFLSTRGYGLFVDSAACTRFDMGASNQAVFSLIVPDSALDYYIIAGPDPKTILTRYAQLTGFPPQVPRWAFGLWLSSSFGPDSAEKTLERARKMRELDIPCDVIHLDCFWQRSGSWSDLVWDTANFPDPPALMRQLKDMGYKICVWENPYLSVQSDRFPLASEKGYLLKNPQGSDYILDLWDGFQPPVAMIDFTNPDAVAWFQDAHRPLLQMGVDAFEPDFGESIPADAVAHNGMTGERLHNLYPLLYNDAICEVMEQETGKPGLLWARSSFAGGQRHAAQWGADCDSSYQSLAGNLRGGLSIGLCGHAFWSHDIGGFSTTPTPELYIRWAEFGLLSPLSRPHGVTTRLPWDYGEEAVRIFRKYTHLRYHLLPYIYSCACKSTESGLPMLRAMWLEFPDDPNTWSLDLQYMFGPDILVAPLYNSTGKRPIYFPAGRWVDYWTHEVIGGPQTRWVQPALDVLPLYVRANALIPTAPVRAYIDRAPFEQVIFEAYLFEQGEFTVYDVDGKTSLRASLEGSTLKVSLDGNKREVGLRVYALEGAPQVTSVQVHGSDAAGAWVREPDGSIFVQVRAE